MFTRVITPRLITLRSLTGRKFLLGSRLHHSVPPSVFDTAFSGMIEGAQLLIAMLLISTAQMQQVSASIVIMLWNTELALESLIRIKKMLKRLRNA